MGEVSYLKQSFYFLKHINKYGGSFRSQVKNFGDFWGSEFGQFDLWKKTETQKLVSPEALDDITEHFKHEGSEVNIFVDTDMSRKVAWWMTNDRLRENLVEIIFLLLFSRNIFCCEHQLEVITNATTFRPDHNFFMVLPQLKRWVEALYREGQWYI